MTPHRTVCIDAGVLERLNDAVRHAELWVPDVWYQKRCRELRAELRTLAAQPTQPSEAEEGLAYAIDVMCFLADHVPLDGCENCIEMLAEFGIVPAALTDAEATYAQLRCCCIARDDSV